MTEYLPEMLTTKWWISVVFTSILLNIISSYIKDKIDLLLGAISNRIKVRNTTLKIQRDKRIEHLKQNKSELYLIAFDELSHRIRALTFILMSCSLFLVTEKIIGTFEQNVGLICSAIALILGLSDHLVAIKLSKLVSESSNTESSPI